MEHVNKTVLSLFTAVTAKNNDWYVQLDCKDEVEIPSEDSEEYQTRTPSSVSCGRNADIPCCHLQDVLNKNQEGDTVYITQLPADVHPQCNKTAEIKVQVRKSFILSTFGPTTDQDSGHGIIHGVNIEFRHNCSEACNLTISQSKFSGSSLIVNNLDIWIKDTQFTGSWILAQTFLQINMHGNNIKIHDTEFKNNFPVKETKGRNTSDVCLVGQWNSVELLRSNLVGDNDSQISGIEIMNANIQTLNLIDVQISFFFSALVIRSSSLGVFNVTASIFKGNRDGIDIGQGVTYMAISGSELNSTGSWSVGEEVHGHCYSALKGSSDYVNIDNSVFAHNRASGSNCKGAALYLGGNVHQIPLLLSNNGIFEKVGSMIKSIEVENSVFYDNRVENCTVQSSGYFENGGGAIALYGLHNWINIASTTFLQNEACKGAGIYVGMSDRWLTGSLQYTSAGEVASSRIIIDSCAFYENIAESRGGLMTELTDSLLDTGSSIFTLISNSFFIENNVSYDGAGACLTYLNVSIGPEVTVIIKLSDTYFKGNINTGDYPHGGGGMHMQFTYLSMTSSA